MADDGVFGFDSEEIERMIREASEGLRGAFDRFAHAFAAPGDRSGWGALFTDMARMARSGPATAGENGDGVWAIYTVDDAGDAHVEQVYATEIDALRANRHNTDPRRRVRFLPYGIAVGVLDDTDEAT